MTTLQIVEEISKLSDEEMQEMLQALKDSQVSHQNGSPEVEVPYEVVLSSELEGTEEKNQIIMLDQKIGRRIRVGEEGNQDQIAALEGVSGATLETPSGRTIISGPTLSGGELARAINRDFGRLSKGGAIFLSDGFYFLYRDSDIRKVLSEDLTDLQMWINTYFDCDDFAEVVTGAVNRQLKGVPFGTLWFKGPGIYHAVNCFYSKEQRKMKVVAPQTDAIYDFDKSRYSPMLVLI